MSSARSIIERLFPVRNQRDRALRILAESIECANCSGPASWEITLFPNYIRLNVGRGLVLTLRPNRLVCMVTGKLLRAIPKEKRAAFQIRTKYKFVPDAYEGNLSANSLSTFEHLSAAHRDLIERAARGRSVSLWPDAHSPGVILLLREHGYQTKNPAHVRVSQPSSSGERRTLEDLDEMDNFTVEGRKKLRQHLIAERNSTLVRHKKAAVLDETGHLVCEVCRFDFAKMYGSLGYNFAEAHHTIPIAGFKRARRVSLKELAIVCSNCHRMLHRGDPVLTLPELRKRYKQAHTARSIR